MPDVLDNKTEPGRPSISYLIMAISMTFGQRFVLPLGRYELGISLVIFGVLVAYWFVRGYTYIHTTRLLMYLAAVGGIVVCAVVNSDDPDLSLAKVVYLIVLYASWVFVHHDARGPIPIYRYFRLCMTIIAFIGIAQFAVQVIGIRSIDLFTLLPERIVAKGYYSHQPLSWGAAYFKSNGVVLYEPSYYSRMLAMALAIELLVFKQLWRIVLFGVAILPAFSGTGLIILIGLYPRFLIDRPKLVGGLTLAGAILLIPVILFTNTGRTFLGRTGEFSSGDSSGHLRFVAPYTKLIESFDSEYLLGNGPGKIDQFENVRLIALKRDRWRVYSFGYSSVKQVDAYANTIVTLIYELGVISGLPLFVYIVYCFFRRVWSYPVSIALFLHLMFLAGDFTQVETLMLCYGLGFMSIRPLATVDTAVREFATRRRVREPALTLSPSAALS